MVKKYIEAAIFDLDGTLVDSKKDIIMSVNYMLKALGIKEKPEKVIQSYIGIGRDKLISDALGHNATPKIVENGTAIFEKHYARHMFDTTQLFPGVREILDYLKDKKLMIVTNKNHAPSVKTLKHFGVDRYFSKVIGGDDKNCRKPDGCPIRNLIMEEGIPLDRAIMIGDSDIDIKAGKIAGIATCGLTYGIGLIADIKKASPDYILDDIRQLKNIIY